MAAYNNLVSMVEKLGHDGDDDVGPLPSLPPIPRTSDRSGSSSGADDDWGLYDEPEDVTANQDETISRQLQMENDGETSLSGDITKTTLVKNIPLNVQDFYNVDVSKLTPEQLQALKEADEAIDRQFAESKATPTTKTAPQQPHGASSTALASGSAGVAKSAVVELKDAPPVLSSMRDAIFSFGKRSSATADVALKSQASTPQLPQQRLTDVTLADVQEREDALVGRIRGILDELFTGQKQDGSTNAETFHVALRGVAQLCGRAQCEAEMMRIEARIQEDKVAALEETCRTQGLLLQRALTEWNAEGSTGLVENVNSEGTSPSNAAPRPSDVVRAEISEQLHYMQNHGLLHPSTAIMLSSNINPTDFQQEFQAQQMALKRTQDVLGVQGETIAALERTNASLRAQLVELEASQESEQKALQEELEKASFDALRYSHTLLEVESKKAELQRTSAKVTSLNQLLDAKNREVGDLRKEMDSLRGSLRARELDVQALMGEMPHGDKDTSIVNMPTLESPSIVTMNSPMTFMPPVRSTIQSTKVFRSIPNEKWWGKSLQRGMATVDTSSMRAGRFLRQNAAVRFAFVVYFLFIHLYVFYLSASGIHSLPAAAGHNVHDHIENHLHPKP